MCVCGDENYCGPYRMSFRILVSTIHRSQYFSRLCPHFAEYSVFLEAFPTLYGYIIHPVKVLQGAEPMVDEST